MNNRLEVLYTKNNKLKITYRTIDIRLHGITLSKKIKHYDYLEEKVSVYYNLHKKCFSIKHKNKVIGYSNYIELSNVKFSVRKSGRLSVLKTKQKNVHAFVTGILKNISNKKENIIKFYSKIITYNPYKYSTFVCRDTEEPIYNSEYVILNNDDNKIYEII